MENGFNFYLLLLGFSLSFLVCFAIVFTKKYHTFDINIENNPQKIHTEYTPRIGGFGIILGIILQLFFLKSQYLDYYLELFIFSFLIFFIGFIEDIRQSLRPILRLNLCFCITLLFCTLLSIKITQVNIYFVDNLLLYSPISIVFTSIAITLLIQSFNIIDGLNGLAILSGKFMIIGVGIISYTQGDFLILNMCLISLGPMLAILLFNFPLGKIFLGDGGAYFLGVWIAILVILMSERNIEVSPFSSLLLIIFPIYETIRSFLRRSIKNISLITLPDLNHFHSLIFKKIDRIGFRYSWMSNSIASLITLILPLITTACAIAFFNDDKLLIFLFFIYIMTKETILYKLRKID